MALSLLIVDPDEQWLCSAKSYFEGINYKVTALGNGKDAQMSLYGESFFAVILNVSVQKHSGIQVLKFIRANYPLQKVLMITEVDKSKDSEEQWTQERLEKAGATEVAVKPFEFEHLKELLEGHQSVMDMMGSVTRREKLSEVEEGQWQDGVFTKISADEFYSGQTVLFDIFIRREAGSYLKILHIGDCLSKERIDKYLGENGESFLYFQKKDIYKYVKFNNFFTKKAISNKKISGDKKVKMLQNVSEKFLEQAFLEGIRPLIINQGQKIAENIYELIKNQEDLHLIFKDYDDFDSNIYTHAYLVAIFSTAIIKQFEWQSKTTMECTAFACFFHDLGKIKIDPKIAKMRISDMSDDQLEEYQKHPELGAKLIDATPLIHNSVKQIILQHHEHFDGSGFPFGKRGSAILMLSNIVCLADDFVHIIQDEGKKPVEALKILLSRREKLLWYNSSLVESLIKVFADPLKIAPKDGGLNSKSSSKKAS